MKIFEVDITGSGTKDEIVASLLELVKTIKTSKAEDDVVAEDENSLFRTNQGR